MSKKILVAVDGSQGSKRALAAATEQASRDGAGIVLCYIIEWTPYSFHTPEELEERHQRRESEIKRAEESVLQPELQALADADIKAEAIVRHGKIAETLNSITAETDASQIYIGRQGESGLKAIIFGSVTAALVQSSSVPVTVVP